MINAIVCEHTFTDYTLLKIKVPIEGFCRDAINKNLSFFTSVWDISTMEVLKTKCCIKWCKFQEIASSSILNGWPTFFYEFRILLCLWDDWGKVSESTWIHPYTVGYKSLRPRWSLWLSMNHKMLFETLSNHAGITC